MKSREQRRTVLIRARMRIGASWGDVNILNISSRGLMIHSAQAPAAGSYLELRRGRHAIVARVVWTSGQRFGVRTQDPLIVDAIMREPDLSAPEARQSQENGAPPERRAARAQTRRTRERHEGSRMLGRALEFACIGTAGASAAIAGYGAVAESLGRPLSEVSAALAPN